ncbi:2-dehydro-3-deoxyphosphooctonate aldolase (KDO 8-P synthase) [Desulfonatronum thiosulfatophilum]|uniref:2-dehydro-3-deoxyphosphooctonate aldolase n=1 Tax=Desulfonatronum thiosulfatophilum TaxID=617002 RepID=A0A1G6AU19_9BACT|nr:3-deoxy-8-phosphooctulonate synthase [Desulfonatronum thiosulfatophilum]SDB11713.1 2-dehydro-3-deoxyphosphooctonate aldolase (KDO 8-P synthase) [Desulfonatronum thiosulfatophilum]
MNDSQELYQRSQSGPFLIAGPCVLESLELALEVANFLAEIARREQLLVIFKSSFDKANRSSLESFRGPGLEQGLEWLARIKQETGLPVITDIHEPRQAEVAGKVADVLQIPAFLCRQTDLLLAAGETGRVVNIKKGQFVAPWDLRPAVAKVRSTGNSMIWLTERGSSFGYNNLVVDYRSFPLLEQYGHPVIFDATHSVQLPGGKGHASDGQREFVPVLAKAAVAAGCAGVFLEVHPRPEQALCDGPNSWPLDKLPALLTDLLNIWRLPRDS